MPGTSNYTTPGLFDSHTGGNPFGFAEVENLLYTTLAVDIDGGTSSIDVVSAAGFPTRGIFTIGNEVITYTGISAGVQFTGCSRGVDGTVGAAHAAGATVQTFPSAAHQNDHSVAIVAIEAAVPRKLAETTLVGAASTIDFTSIPQTYRHLYLVLASRNTVASSNVLCQLSTAASFDAGGNYDYQWLFSFGATVAAVEGLAQTSMIVGAHGTTSPIASGLAVTFHHYAGATFQKMMTSQYSRKDNTSPSGMYAGLLSGFWRNTGAIDGIRLLLGSNQFAIGTQATLYGLP